MKNKHLELKDRQELETLYLQGKNITEIAEALQVHRSTIYNELARGDTHTMDCNGRCGYSAEIAQRQMFERQLNRKRKER